MTSFNAHADRYAMNEMLTAVDRGFVYRKTLKGAARWASIELFGDDSRTHDLVDLYQRHGEP